MSDYMTELMKAHQEFSQRAHLVRWFGERSLKEMKALKDSFEMAKRAKEAKRTNATPTTATR